MRKTLVGLLALCLVASLSATVSAQQDQSDNVTLETSIAYTMTEADRANPFFKAGTDMDFSGKFIYAMQQGMTTGAVHILKATKKKVTEISTFPCAGEQNDVAVVKPGLIAVGYHTGNCAPATHGVLLLDVKKPRTPKLLGSVDMTEGTHTLTVYPGTDLIYASPGGLANADGELRIIDVSDPTKPTIAATYTSSTIGCHDLTFYIAEDEKLAFCPGAGETQIWDVSDPLAPTQISHITNPSMQIQHTAYATFDGNYLAITDEAEASECAGGTVGNVWLYDITNRQAPVPVSTFDIERGAAASSPNNSPAGTGRSTWCSAHNGGFIPGTYQLVLSWYASGWDVIDFADPTAPTEIAFYNGGDSNYWSAYWHKGRIYANDREFAKLDVFKVAGLAEGKV